MPTLSVPAALTTVPPITKPILLAFGGIVAVLPVLPLSPAARTASAIALAGLLTGALGHDVATKRLSR
ncbi:hypothetical protein LWF15_27635 [Kineosporia rhizophila]|uniref:hypothetical protein n=1 Tax=Kineosporia TaxID=49184 RepID=UPI001E4C6CA5|nr:MULTISPECIES: hypothetical protein [Kineosporia]MCE0539276.1 hypothetical protein [Kineosporia rhizophila]GLY14437.1 hypothetical protein Kisp01_14520 [Kineosporia sp. NBRC 101677]